MTQLAQNTHNHPNIPIHKLELRNVDPLKLNHQQIVQIISAFKFADEEEKQKAFQFMKRSIFALNKVGRLNESLIIENNLYSFFLKYCETESDYNAFYGTISDCYSIIKKRTKLGGQGVGFFVHSPHFLAHVNTLFNLLQLDRGRSIKPEDVTIFTLSKNPMFDNAFAELGIRVEALDLRQISDLPLMLAARCRIHKIGNLVWQCLPNFLGYTASKIEGISWWSLKFHPNIRGLKNYITNSSFQGSLNFNSRCWSKFTPPTFLKNLTVTRQPWSARKDQFGAFCREELIDEENYWRLVACIIKAFDLRFCYTGRQPIHQKYLEQNQISQDKVEFLGWLKEPEADLRNMAFILDGGSKGHGMMASEAIAAGVPVLWPFNYTKSQHSRINKIYGEARSQMQGISDDKFYALRYDCEQSLLKAIKLNCLEERENEASASLQMEMMKFRKDDDLSTFLSIIRGESQHLR